MNIIISGATGFIGSHLREDLLSRNNINVYSLTRKPKTRNDLSYDDFYNNKLDLKINCFIHLASPNYDYCSDSSIDEGIVKLTEKILKTLPYYRCSKFIFFSSIKVYGEASCNKKIFFENSKVEPETDYGKAKAKAEILIKDNSLNFGIDYIIYRLPFVYGKGMKSNISKLTSLIDKSLPIPVFNTKKYHQKSFLSIKNLNRTIMNNIDNLETINNDVINLADLKPLSLFEFLIIYKHLSRSKSFIIGLPYFMFVLSTKIPILKYYVIKIFGSFVVDNAKIKNILGNQLVTTYEGINSTIDK